MLIRRVIPSLGTRACSARYNSSTSTASPRLAQWIADLPSNVLQQEDHISLTRVQALVSSLQVPGDGVAQSWERGDTLPEGWTLIFFPPSSATTSSLGFDGTERTPHHPPPSCGLDERMWVGGSFRFAEGENGLRIGDEVSCEATIAGVKERTGKDGRRGLYVEQRREIGRKGAKESSVVESRVHLYRPSLSSSPPPFRPSAATPAAPPTKARPVEADFSLSFLPNPLLLFRFSALTFNTHRIHWDEAYCRDVERREGLIVHGPLTALLLLNTFRHSLPPGTKIESFEYRATAPLVVNRRVAFCGKWLDAKKEGRRQCELWVEGEDGTVYMSGIGTVVHS